MSNHIHLILYFPEGRKRIDFMRDFKKFTSTKIRKEVERVKPELLDTIRIESGKQVFKVWQDRFDEVYLKNKKLLEVKLEYIHTNPLQENRALAKHPEEYLHSSSSYYECGKKSPLEVSHSMDFVQIYE